MIKKSELLADEYDVHTEELQILEHKIDEFLKKRGIPCRFGASEFSKQAVNMIKTKYEKEGEYSVKIEHFGPEHDLIFS